MKEVFFPKGESAKWYPILFDSPLNVVRAVAFWLTIALLIAFIVVMIVTYKKPIWQSIKKFAGLGFVLYASALVILSLVFGFYNDSIVPLLFYPILVFLLLLMASSILLFFKKEKVYKITCFSCLGASLIAVLVCMGIHFQKGDAAEANWLTNNDVNQLGLYLSAGLLVGALLFAALYIGRKDKSGFTNKSIAYGAICISMSFALSFIRILKMPQGGSITIASLLPIMIYAYIFGIKKGTVAGLIYGILEAFQSPTILHPAQFLLDYPMAFACMGLTALFVELNVWSKRPKLQFMMGGVVAFSARFLMHFLSGIFAFGTFAPEGTPVAVYSLGYQTVYLIPDMLICLVVGFFLFSSKSFVRSVKQVRTV